MHRIKDLIRQGLSSTNLRELIRLCEQQFANKPAIYGTLISIFRALEREYDYSDAIETGRYTLINSTLEKPLLDFVDSASQSAGSIMHRLDNLMVTFHTLS